MKITDIKKSANSKSDIYIDDEYAFFLYQSDIAKTGIKSGLEIKKEEYEELKKIVFKNALGSALRLVCRCDYTVKMIKEKLCYKKYPSDAVKYATDYLMENRYVDDYTYARKFIKEAFEVKKKGKAYVKAELLRRGISKEVVEELSEKYYDNDEIITITDKKYKTLIKDKETPDFKDLNKLKNYLLRQGFSYEEIVRAIETVKESYEH